MRGVVAVVAVLAAGAGCAGARYVQKEADGGVIAVPDRSDSWPTYHRTKADALIRDHVGPDFEVVDQWTEKVGEQSVPNPDPAHQQSPGQPGEAAPDGTTYQDSTEWRIKYRRKPGGTATPEAHP